MEKRNPRLTTGSSAVHSRSIIGTRSTFCSCCRPVKRRFFVPENIIYGHVREYVSILKPGHTPGGSVRGGAQRNDGAGRGQSVQEADDGTLRRGENKLYWSPEDGRMISWVWIWKHEQEKSYLNRRRNKTRG